jgi:mono/diheme cytochrome c family protein
MANAGECRMPNAECRKAECRIGPVRHLAFGIWHSAFFLAFVSAVVAQATRSVWDGVYTEAQAKRGSTVYHQHCASCHGPELEGNGETAGPLVGPVFTSNWNGVTVGDMFERTRVSMPLDKPGTLSRQQIADVLAYMFSENKLPVGKSELARQPEILKQIKFEAVKPTK